jgi:hypothetical protein
MDITKTTNKRPAQQKDIDHLSDEDDFDSYEGSEISQSDSDDTNGLDQLGRSKSNSITTSDTQSIQRETPPQDHRHAPTTEIARRETNTAIQRPRGIAPIQPLPEQQPRGQTVAKDAKTALSLRLDLNLDIEVELKAKIKGDLTLTLLLVFYHSILRTVKLKIYSA